jgi:hypothetical protein
VHAFICATVASSDDATAGVTVNVHIFNLLFVPPQVIKLLFGAKSIFTASVPPWPAPYAWIEANGETPLRI